MCKVLIKEATLVKVFLYFRPEMALEKVEKKTLEKATVKVAWDEDFFNKKKFAFCDFAC